MARPVKTREHRPGLTDRYSVSLPMDLMATIDRLRGFEPRSSFIARILTAHVNEENQK